ncbi:unnamed protein product [Amoebophrya sp. A120]|nr:unnamed protein product [Amoebophrya sp. A120]|eukprot:GSA120T00002588001.1
METKETPTSTYVGAFPQTNRKNACIARFDRDAITKMTTRGRSPRWGGTCVWCKSRALLRGRTQQASAAFVVSSTTGVCMSWALVVLLQTCTTTAAGVAKQSSFPDSRDENDPDGFLETRAADAEKYGENELQQRIVVDHDGHTLDEDSFAPEFDTQVEDDGLQNAGKLQLYAGAHAPDGGDEQGGSGASPFVQKHEHAPGVTNNSPSKHDRKEDLGAESSRLPKSFVATGEDTSRTSSVQRQSFSQRDSNAISSKTFSADTTTRRDHEDGSPYSNSTSFPSTKTWRFDNLQDSDFVPSGRALPKEVLEHEANWFRTDHKFKYLMISYPTSETTTRHALHAASTSKQLAGSYDLAEDLAFNVGTGGFWGLVATAAKWGIRTVKYIYESMQVRDSFFHATSTSFNTWWRSRHWWWNQRRTPQNDTESLAKHEEDRKTWHRPIVDYLRNRLGYTTRADDDTTRRDDFGYTTRATSISKEDTERLHKDLLEGSIEGHRKPHLGPVLKAHFIPHFHYIYCSVEPEIMNALTLPLLDPEILADEKELCAEIANSTTAASEDGSGLPKNGLCQGTSKNATATSTNGGPTWNTTVATILNFADALLGSCRRRNPQTASAGSSNATGKNTEEAEAPSSLWDTAKEKLGLGSARYKKKEKSRPRRTEADERSTFSDLREGLSNLDPETEEIVCDFKVYGEWHSASGWALQTAGSLRRRKKWKFFVPPRETDYSQMIGPILSRNMLPKVMRERLGFKKAGEHLTPVEKEAKANLRQAKVATRPLGGKLKLPQQKYCKVELEKSIMFPVKSRFRLGFGMGRLIKAMVMKVAEGKTDYSRNFFAAVGKISTVSQHEIENSALQYREMQKLLARRRMEHKRFVTKQSFDTQIMQLVQEKENQNSAFARGSQLSAELSHRVAVHASPEVKELYSSQDLRRLFAHADKNADGKVDPAEWELFWQEVVDLDRSGTVSIGEFFEVFGFESVRVRGPDEQQRIKADFCAERRQELEELQLIERRKLEEAKADIDNSTHGAALVERTEFRLAQIDEQLRLLFSNSTRTNCTSLLVDESGNDAEQESSGDDLQSSGEESSASFDEREERRAGDVLKIRVMNTTMTIPELRDIFLYTADLTMPHGTLPPTDSLVFFELGDTVRNGFLHLDEFEVLFQAKALGVDEKRKQQEKIITKQLDSLRKTPAFLTGNRTIDKKNVEQIKIMKQALLNAKTDPQQRVDHKLSEINALNPKYVTDADKQLLSMALLGSQEKLFPVEKEGAQLQPQNYAKEPENEEELLKPEDDQQSSTRTDKQEESPQKSTIASDAKPSAAKGDEQQKPKKFDVSKYLNKTRQQR